MAYPSNGQKPATFSVLNYCDLQMLGYYLLDDKLSGTYLVSAKALKNFTLPV